MIQKIPFKLALSALLFILSLVVIFHVLVIFKVIPYSIVWAGKIASDKQMYQFEVISISINIFLIIVVLIQGDLLNWRIKPLVIKIFLFLFSAIFALNTVGNLFAKMSIETYIFTPITLILALLCFRLGFKNSK